LTPKLPLPLPPPPLLLLLPLPLPPLLLLLLLLLLLRPLRCDAGTSRMRLRCSPPSAPTLPDPIH
jgi:hypothetical protein